MTEEDNVVEFTGEWQGSDDAPEMTDAEFRTAMEELLMTHDANSLSNTIAGVLEFLTVQAVIDGPYYLVTDDEKAISVFAADEAANTLRNILPEEFKNWDQYNTEDEFISNADPGDEQDESATESE